MSGVIVWTISHDTLMVIMISAGMSAASYQIFMAISITDVRLAVAEEDPSELLRRRIQNVNGAFNEATRLMQELQRDLATQEAARESLIREAREQQQLLAVDQEQAENIRQILVGETKATIRAERRQQWMFFLLGVFVSATLSVPIGIWVNSIS